MDHNNNNPSPIPAPRSRFDVSEITGRWCSREGAPEVIVYRNEGRKGGGYWMSFTYAATTVLRRPIKRCNGFCYVNLYGWVGVIYDPEHDVLNLAGYGNYYRPEE